MTATAAFFRRSAKERHTQSLFDFSKSEGVSRNHYCRKLSRSLREWIAISVSDAIVETENG
jgi:hypothetical protein